MGNYKEETVAHLKGDLTQSGVTYNIANFLAASLQHIVSGEDKKIRIDCEKIIKADIRGLQMLYVWMYSARKRGVEPELINLPNRLWQAMQRMGFEHCFADFCTRRETPEFV